MTSRGESSKSIIAMNSTNPSGIKVIREGRFATVLLSLSNRDAFGHRQCSVLKVYHGDNEADAAQRLAKETFFIRKVKNSWPHDFVSETIWDPQACPCPTPPNSIRLDYAPISLVDILDSPPDPQVWQHMARSFAFQLCAGLDFLHCRNIAHRDINPHNLMIGWRRRLKIVDFGSACLVRHSTPKDAVAKSNAQDDWPFLLESPERGNMDYQVGTGTYRAPELLFASTTYDAYAVDTWAMGTVVAAFFSPAMDANMNHSSNGPDVVAGQINMASLSLDDAAPVTNTKASLFDDTFGDLGLAASIFRLRGLPNTETWPEFFSLPDAGKFEFDILPESLNSGVPLLNRLEPRRKAHILDFLSQVLRLGPSQRMSPKAALNHAWIDGSDGLIIPLEGYPFRGDAPEQDKDCHPRTERGPRDIGIESNLVPIRESALEAHYSRAKKDVTELSIAMDGMGFVPPWEIGRGLHRKEE